MGAETPRTNPRRETFAAPSGTHSPVTNGGNTTVRTSVALALLALVANGTAFAGELSGTPARGPRTAALYVEVPLGARHRHKPAFGLRLQELTLPHTSFAAARYAAGPSRTLLDVPLSARKDDPLRGAGAAMLLGKGAIVGIVVGAVVAVSVMSDDDGDGGGY